MKATVDKNGNISWEHEVEKPATGYSTVMPEKTSADAPTRMDKLKERAKELQGQEEDQG